MNLDRFLDAADGCSTMKEFKRRLTAAMLSRALSDMKEALRDD